MKILNWDDAKLGEMNFENICRFYSSDKSINVSQKPPIIRAFYAVSGKKKYAVRWNSYEPDADFTGITNCSSEHFILKGNAQIKIGENTYNLEAGKCYGIPKCEYEFKVTGDEYFEYIAVYEFPDDFSIPA